MYGKHITLSGGDQSITVFVFGTPNLTDEQWETRAKILISRMEAV